MSSALTVDDRSLIAFGLLVLILFAGGAVYVVAGIVAVVKWVLARDGKRVRFDHKPYAIVRRRKPNGWRGDDE